MLEFNEIAKRKCNKLDSGVKGMPLTHAQNGGKGQTTAATRIPHTHTHTDTRTPFTRGYKKCALHVKIEIKMH